MEAARISKYELILLHFEVISDYRLQGLKMGPYMGRPAVEVTCSFSLRSSALTCMYTPYFSTSPLLEKVDVSPK